MGEGIYGLRFVSGESPSTLAERVRTFSPFEPLKVTAPLALIQFQQQRENTFAYLRATFSRFRLR